MDDMLLVLANDALSKRLPEEQEEILTKIVGHFLKTVETVFDPVKIPPYSVFIGNVIKLRRRDWHFSRGYFSDFVRTPEPIWSLHETGRAWMSTDPMELESHQPHIAMAHGNVVVCGLGMGLAVYNMALKPEVKSIMVVEINLKMMRAFRRFSNYENWPPEIKNKISFIRDDVIQPEGFEWEPVDYMYCDTWLQLYGDEGVPHTRSSRNSLLIGQKPRYVSLWGQELEYASWATANEEDMTKESSWAEFCDAIFGFQLYWPTAKFGGKFEDYAELCRTAWSRVCRKTSIGS